MLNRVLLMGRLVVDPELRYTGNDTAVTSFRIAVDRDKKPGGEKQTDFISITAWRQTAEFVSKYFSKGQLIVLCGRLQVRDYTDKNGDKKTIYEVVADNVWFAGDSVKEKPEKPVTFSDIDVDDEELPF